MKIHRINAVLLLFFVGIVSGLLVGCGSKNGQKGREAFDWNGRKVALNPNDSLGYGSTYLSVYSQIYSETEHQTHDLTVTVSMRNANMDTVFVTSAKYYNTHGELIRTYFDGPIFLLPMETVEIIIAELDKEGGTGGNFIFEWAADSESMEPLFEAVMISTSGQQGLSFTTEGKRIN